MSAHEQFEELAALAALGQASVEELSALNAHLSDCKSCQEALAEFSHILHAELPRLHDESVPWFRRVLQLFAVNGYKERFFRRARALGFTLSRETDQAYSRVGRFVFPRRLQYAFMFFLVVVLAALTATSVRLRKTQGAFFLEAVQLQRTVSELSRDKDSLERQVQTDLRVIADLQSKLAAAQKTTQDALGRATFAEQERDKAKIEGKQAKSALDAELAKSSALSARLQGDEHRLAELSEEIHRATGLRAADSAMIASQQKQLDEMTQELRAQKEVLEKERQLLAAGRDIRELMGARNLHIIDVFDTDRNGNNRRAFGRIFYTEGKSLIFYAFDLSRGNVLSVKHSFQAWGLRDGETAAARSLGIFYVDDAAQKRWMLKVDDPDVLRQIDSVFVTVEPFGGAKNPSGAKLLYAYLKNRANHP